MQATLNQFLAKRLITLPDNANTISLAQALAFWRIPEQSDSSVCGRGSMLLHIGMSLPILPDHAVSIGIDGDIGLDQQHTLLLHLDRVTDYNGKPIGFSALSLVRSLVNLDAWFLLLLFKFRFHREDEASLFRYKDAICMRSNHGNACFTNG